MTAPLSHQEIEREARSLVTAQPSAMGVEVSTPVVYPNGDCVTVIVAPTGAGDTFLVHDAGLGAMFLLAEGITLTRDASERVSSAVGRYMCRFAEGRVFRECKADEIAASIMLVANGSRTVGDYATEVRRQTDDQFRYALTECVREAVGARARQNEIFKGRSGRGYRVANIILDEAQTRPVAFVVPLASRGAVAHQFRELYDLKAAMPDVLNESVYKEDSDFRPDEDGWVLRQVGELVPFHQLKPKLARLVEPALR